MSKPHKSKVVLSIHDHPRLSEFNRLVYPVISRRAGGLSLGINLNPSKSCSFNCVYCQVNRNQPIKGLQINLAQIESELTYWIGEIQQNPGEFHHQELKDISVAGDGEPTLVKCLPEVLLKMIQVRDRYRLKDCDLVLFTNGSKLNRPDLLEVLPEFHKNNGQIWYKLDFWNEESYLRINRSSVPYSRTLDNLITVSTRFPVVLQSCFFSWDNQPFSDSWVEEYVNLINRLQQKGAQIRLIQAYTVARQPAESFVKPWSDKEMNKLYEVLVKHLTMEIKLIYGSAARDR